MSSLSSSLSTSSSSISLSSASWSLVALYGLCIFLVVVALIALAHSRHLFLSWHGWTHRFFGGMHLGWLLFGAYLLLHEATTVTHHAAAATTATGTTTTIIFSSDNVNGSSSSISLSSSYFLISPRMYDFILGILGILATISAAIDFPHRYVSNAVGQSGTLHRKAIVTQNEMIEHAFYQFLNLWQALYLHILSDFVTMTNQHHHHQQQRQQHNVDGIATTTIATATITQGVFEDFKRLTLLWLVTAPWLIRHWLPVHSFSHNWKFAEKTTKTTTTTNTNTNTNATNTKISTTSLSSSSTIKSHRDAEIFLYRIKKTQYLFYKHVILHGVNISLAISSLSSSSSSSATAITTTITTTPSIPNSLSWRIFWLALNTSYVMEFFLQTMVKRRVLNQSTMLWLQRGLMGVSSLAAIIVLHHVSFVICILSLLLNFIHRHHDVFNTIMIGILAMAFFPW